MKKDFELPNKEGEKMSAAQKLLHSQENEFFLRNQVDAIARVIALVGEKEKATLDDIFHRLADAERESAFFCGFVDLDEKDEEYKEALKKYLITNKFIEIDSSGFAVLTDKGKDRGEINLPPQIEEVL